MARLGLLHLLSTIGLCAALWLTTVGTCLAGVRKSPDTTGAAPIEIAATVCLTGEDQYFGEPALEGMQLAIDEANARGDGPSVVLKAYDEASSPEVAKRVATEIVHSRAVLSLGSAFTFLALVEGPIFADAGLADLPTATSDLITRNATTFRVTFRNSEEGEVLATYLSRVLGQRRAVVIAAADGYGTTLRKGFEGAAERLGMSVTSLTFNTIEEGRQVAQTVADDPSRPPVALLMLAPPAAAILPILRRGGITGPILGSIAMGDSSFKTHISDEPEERRRPGALTDGMYATSPMILDSANAEILAFADRYRRHYGHEPGWVATAAYDSAQVALAALRKTANAGSHAPAELRARVLDYIRGLDSPGRALPGLLGPIWFDQERGRAAAIRMGRMNGDQLASAPLQIVPVALPSASEIASGAVFEIASGRYGRLQRVVYSGIFLNEISHIDLPRSSFGADFYVWLRFAKDAGPNGVDPSDINFPNMISGSFDPKRPAEQGEMPDGTAYRLWRVQGEFRNDYDLHAFPFDRQRLALPFYNASGASDRIIYVLDKRSIAGGSAAGNAGPGQPPQVASPTAFDDLTQWRALGQSERRENLVTASSLGDPRRTGTEAYRELSGFIATFDVKRRALSTVAKSLMPLLLMTLIIYTTLHFPPVLIKEKVTVAITGALSGAVLLTAINSQLGSIGYTIAIEYAFFVFFGLTTFIIVAALAANHLRHVKRDHLAAATERGTRVVFLLAIVGLLLGAWWISAQAAGRP